MSEEMTGKKIRLGRDGGLTTFKAFVAKESNLK